MHSRQGFVLKHRIYGGYLNKHANELTDSLFSALTFDEYDKAKWWLNNAYAKPAKPKDFEVIETVEQRFEKEESA